VFTGDTSSVLYAVSPLGVEQWNVTTGPGHYWWSSPAIGRNGTIYVGDPEGDCLAFAPTGQIRWRVPTGQPAQNVIIISEPAIGVDGTVYVASIPAVPFSPVLDGPEKLFALSPDGHTNWIASLEPSSAVGQHISSPAIGPDGSIYIGCSSNLYCVSADGAVKWRHQLEGLTLASPAFGPDGTVYIGSDYGKFYAVSPDGERNWTCSFGSGFGVESSAAVAADGTIRIAMWGAPSLRALTATGELLWEGPFSSDQTTSSPALDSSGNVYILSSSRGLLC